MPLPPGTRLGPYEIVAPLGAGGMGEVYRARDTRLGREVAIKVLPLETTAAEDPTGSGSSRARSRDERMARFAREARAASALSHPNVATIYEYGDAEGRAFIAMELVEGQPLSARIAGQPLPTREVVDLALQVADALEEAHGRGITHRDIKPANLMVTPRGRVKVLDFGLARLAPRELAAEASTELATQTGTTLGTVPYMSPEQALGRDVDGRSDLFSLGAVIYEMATGRRAFDGGSASATTDLILHGQPMAIARLNYDVPEELERIVRKCLEKDRERRYQSARDLVVDLGNLKRDLEFGSGAAALRTPADGSPAAAPAPSGSPASGSLSPAIGVDSDRAATARASGAVAASRSVWRRPWVIVGAAIVLALAVALTTYQWRFRGASITKSLSSIAVLPLDNLSGKPDQEWFSDGITESLIAELSKIRALKVISRTSVMQYKGARRPLPEIARELGVEAIVEGSARLVGTRVLVTAQLIDAAADRHMWAQEYDRELSDVISLQREVARTIAGEIRVALTPEERDTLSRAHPVIPAAQEALLRGRSYFNLSSKDPENLRRALACFQDAARLDPEYAEARAWVAKTYGKLGNWGLMPQAEAFQQSRDNALQALALDDRSAEAHKAIVWWHFTWQHDWPSAEREIQRALALDPNDDEALGYSAEWCSLMGRHDEAIRAAQRARELAPTHMGRFSAVGMLQYFAHRFDDATATFQAVLKREPGNLDALNYLWQIRYLTGAHAGLFESWREVDRADPAMTDADRSAIERAYQTGGWPAVFRGRIAWLSRRPATMSVANASGWIALCHVLLGEYDKAFAQLEVCFREHSSWMFQLQEPMWDPIRRDPRFKDLRRRLNLPEE